MGKGKQFYNIDTLLKTDVPCMIFFQKCGTGRHHAIKAYEDMKKWVKKYNSTK